MIATPHSRRFGRLIAAVTLAASFAVAAMPAALADATAKPAVLLAKFTFDAPDVIGAWHEEPKAGSEPSELVIDTTNPHSGASSLKYCLKADVDSQRDIYTGVTLAPGDKSTGRKVRFRFFARTDETGKGDASLRVLERGPAGVIGWLDNKLDIVKVDKGAAWTEYTGEGKLSDATTMLTLEVAIAKGTVGRTVWVDDLSVEQIPGGDK
ncbi:MAG TPA: hypothetical protein VGK19_17755 [Capsulimonadaceae bacterium]|jgi:hypothetical protein